MKWLNYQHLYYFWHVVRVGTVTEAASQLRLAQPTLSAQIKLLEEQLNLKLLEKQGRRLKLTAAGKLAFQSAEQIFALGSDLVDQLEQGQFSNLITFKVGISDVIPKILAYRILEPLYFMPDTPKLACFENHATQLLAALTIREIDLVISDSPLPTSVNARLYSHPLGTSTISFLATRQLARLFKIKQPKDLSGPPILLPSKESALRLEIDNWLAKLGISVNVAGEFQDSALMKIFGRQGRGVFPVPSAIENEVCKELDVIVVTRAPITQTYYLIATEKRLSNPIITHLYQSAKSDIFGSK